jgi:hypothetical protein
MYFICRQCSARLSSDLEQVPLSVRNEQMGADFLPRGKVMLEDGSYFLGRAGIFIAHVEDAANVRLTDDPRRLNGCCGLDGVDGPNLQCQSCGSYIATKMTDCWQPHCVIFDPIATEMIPESHP